MHCLGVITGGDRGGAGDVGSAALPPLVAQIGGSGCLDAGAQLCQLGAGAWALRQGAQEEWREGAVRRVGMGASQQINTLTPSQHIKK